MSISNGENFSLDNVLSEVGEFGLFQKYTYFLLFTVRVLSSFTVVNYMISANTLDYRCKIPECDIGKNNRDIRYDPSWLHYAIPISNGKIESCFRYASRHTNSTASGECSADMFDTSIKISCSEYIYASDERNVQTEFNIHCSENYKLALIGTIGNVGRFIFLPISGLLADKFGRLPGIIIGLMLSSAFAILKSFSINYYMYIILEFIESSAGACAFTGVNVLAIEWVNSNYRVLGSTIQSLSFPMGEVLIGLVAMFVHDFRTLIRILHTPGLFAFICFWLLPESVRWLLVNGRVKPAVSTLQRIARVNRKELSSKSIELLNLYYSTESLSKNMSIEQEEHKNKEHSVIESLCMILKSRTLRLRFLICCYQWVACTFSYYGLSMTSTHIPGADRYLSFIIIMLCEIPGVIISQPLLNRMKRRWIMGVSITLAAILIVLTPFIPKEYPMIVLLFLVLGKTFLSCAFTVLNIYTAEQWPTNIRNTIHNSCSMIGRFGSMMAPLVVVLSGQHSSLPILLFGSTAIIAGISLLFCRETYSKKLPDTIEEAENL